MLRRLSLLLLFALGTTARARAAQEEFSCDECAGDVWFVRAGAKAGGADGRAWSTAFRRLQDAVDRAEDGDCIWVAAGRYFTSSSGNRSQRFKFDKSLRVYGGFAGNEVCLSSRAGLFGATHLSGEIGSTSTHMDNALTVVDVSGPVSFGQPSPQVMLDGFQIRGAFNPTGTGGGVQVRDHTLELRNCVIADNRSGYGAGLYAEACRLDLVNCTIRNNRATFDGGGLWLGGVSSAVWAGGGTNATNIVLSGNKAGAKGGGLYLADTSLFGLGPVVFTNTLLRNNTAKQGGAGYMEEALSTGGFIQPAKAEMTHCTAADNTSTFAGSVKGAAFVVEDSLFLIARHAQLDLTNCVLWGNQPTSPTSPAIDAVNGEGLLVGYSILDAGSPHACQPLALCTNDPGCTVFDCDPLFLPLSPYHPDPYASPALDSGFRFLPPDVFDLDDDGDLLENTPFDLDGNAREQGVTDRGAFEAP
jgi:hypothetical protein